MNILGVKLSLWVRRKIKQLQRFLSGLYEKEGFFYKMLEFVGRIEDSYLDRKENKRDLRYVLAYLSSEKFCNEVDISKGWESDEEIPEIKMSEKLYDFLLTERAQRSLNYKILSSESKKDLGKRVKLKRV